MSSSLRQMLTIAAVVLLPATAAACGGGNTKTSSTPATAAGAPSGAPSAGSTVKATGGGDFCKTVADSLNSVSQQAAANLGTPDAMRKSVEDSKKKSQQVLAKAPGEIKGDLQTLLNASSAMGDALAKANYDVTKIQPDTLSSFSTPAVQTASTHVLAYVKQHCGIDLTPGGSPATSATTDTTGS